MKIVTRQFLRIMLLSLILNACVIIPRPHSENVHVMSLKYALPYLEKSAAEWHPDAYLVSVDISLDIQENNQIDADFRSPSENYGELGVTYHSDGKISVQRFKTEVEIAQLEPIRDSDWMIDSQQALDIMMTEQDIEFINSGLNVRICSNFILDRDPVLPDHRVVWHLSL